MERSSGNYSLKAYLDELNHPRRILAELNRNILALSRTDEYRANVLLLRTVPGISTLTAMTLLTELNSMNRFSSLDKLASYVGLIPNTNSSGEKNNTNTKAIIHIARKLLNRIRYVLKNQNEYVPAVVQ